MDKKNLLLKQCVNILALGSLIAPVGNLILSTWDDLPGWLDLSPALTAFLSANLSARQPDDFNSVVCAGVFTTGGS
jgi:hypothetical protein